MSNRAEIPEDDSYRCPVCDALFEGKPSGGGPACPHCRHVIWFARRQVDGVTVLDVLSGTVAINADIHRVSEQLLRDAPSPHVVLNLARLRFISSAFVAGMIALQKRVRSAGGRLILCGMHRVVRETLHGARLDGYFEICEDDKSALKALSQTS